MSVYSGGASSSNPDYDPALTAAIARLPHVRHVAAGIEVTGAPLTSDGSPRLGVTGEAYPVASIDGLLFTQDRVAVTQGRMSSPTRPDEIVMSPQVARQFGFHVGQVSRTGSTRTPSRTCPASGRAPFRLPCESI